MLNNHKEYPNLSNSKIYQKGKLEALKRAINLLDIGRLGEPPLDPLQLTEEEKYIYAMGIALYEITVKYVSLYNSMNRNNN